ncbi:membrane-associated guanylate kinase, WW and PDZ domain-containing protein 1-like protein [Lates japonicus]|uniref:Membrane-associated guanylate kinase, WW and PDZ domain-containing protein 1-like protein n=1 Tax=Lates japonicus TaxID=270547 RepID=A0AAD3M4G6_LATJO|nr:membrane-associated guanylate kinase, WW and PDZ domain-containing protein 1-like protein [Lates japonicus]
MISICFQQQLSRKDSWEQPQHSASSQPEHPHRLRLRHCPWHPPASARPAPSSAPTGLPPQDLKQTGPSRKPDPLRSGAQSRSISRLPGVMTFLWRKDRVRFRILGGNEPGEPGVVNPHCASSAAGSPLASQRDKGTATLQLPLRRAHSQPPTPLSARPPPSTPAAPGEVEITAAKNLRFRLSSPPAQVTTWLQQAAPEARNNTKPKQESFEFKPPQGPPPQPPTQVSAQDAEFTQDLS